jgi:hypothetical protein
MEATLTKLLNNPSTGAISEIDSRNGLLTGSM